MQQEIDRLQVVVEGEFELLTSIESVRGFRTTVAGNGMVDITINGLECSLAALPQPREATDISERTIRVPALYTLSLPSTNAMGAGRLLSQSSLQQHGKCDFKFNAGANWG